MSIYYNFTQINPTANPVLLNQTDVANNIILAKASDYKVSLVKFNLPNRIETFINDDDEDYTITYQFTTNNSSASAFVTPSFTQSLYLSSVLPMYSINEFVENYNRSSLVAFKGLLTEANAYYNNVVSRSASGSNATVTDKRDITLDFSTGLPSTLYCSYIKLAANIRGTSTKQNLEIQLIDPSGNKCIVGGGEQYENKVIEYEDGAAYSQNTTTVLSEDSYQPVEAFIKLCKFEANQNGTWIVRVLNKNSNAATSFNISFNVTLTLYFSPVSTNQTYFPRLAPTLELNGDSFEFILDDNIPRTSFQIQFSPKLDQILSFPTVYNSATGKYILRLPQTTIQDNSSLSTYVYKQPLPTAYKALDLCEIQIRSNNLPVSGERSSVTSESIVSSVDIDTSDLNNSVYQYVNQMLNDRSYQLNSDISLSKINIAVFVRYRTNNRVIPVYLPGYTTFNLLLKFISLKE